MIAPDIFVDFECWLGEFETSLVVGVIDGDLDLGRGFDEAHDGVRDGQVEILRPFINRVFDQSQSPCGFRLTGTGKEK